MAKIKQAVKHTGRGRKELIVAELTEKIDASNGLVFTDYKGITHKQLEDLKRELKKLDATIVIAKNSLMRISLGKSQKYADFKDNEGLDLPTATLFIRGDMVEPLKKLQKASKESGLPKIKFGILEGQLTDEAGVLKIASLPSRDTLIAQFVGTLNSPIQGLVVTLNGTIQKFVMTLDAITKNKPADQQSVAPTTESAPPVQKETAPAVADATTDEITVEATPEAENQVDSKEEAVEPAVSANEPAVQPEAPIETDELVDAGTETKETKSEVPNTNSEIITKEEKS
jgi:large subunit ribosomal protein L10